METPVTTLDVLEGVALGPACENCKGLIERTCPAARLVLKVEGIREFEKGSWVDSPASQSLSGEYFANGFERFRQAVAHCSGFANVNHFVAHSVPSGNESLVFHMLDLQTNGMAKRAGITPPLVYLDLPKNDIYEPSEPPEPLRVAR